MEQAYILEGWSEDVVNDETCPASSIPKVLGGSVHFTEVGKAKDGRSSWEAPKCSPCPLLPLHIHPASGKQDPQSLCWVHCTQEVIHPPSPDPPGGNKIGKLIQCRPAKLGVQYFQNDRTHLPLSASLPPAFKQHYMPAMQGTVLASKSLEDTGGLACPFSVL